MLAQGQHPGRCVISYGTTVISIMIACSLITSPVGARILQQSSALVDDGSQDSVSPSDSSSKVGIRRDFYECTIKSASRFLLNV